MTPWRLSSSLSLSMLIPGPTVTVRSTRSISWIRFISLTSTTMPPRSGTAPSESPVPPARGTTGMPSRLASLTTSETSSAVRGRTATSGMWSAQRWTGNGAGTRVRFTRELRLSSTRSSSPRIARSSSITAAAADLRGDLGLLDGQPAPAAGAVGPLRDVVDVTELEPGHRVEQLARRRVDALALVEPAGVVVGHGPFDRVRELDPARLDEVVDQLDAEDDLELVVVAVVARVILREGDVVVGVGSDDPLRADRPPVGDVVVGVLAGEVDVAHLRRGPAAAPLLAHQPELHAGGLQQLREGARVGGAMEGRLAVHEQERLAADRDVEAVGPVGDVLLGDRDVAQHGLVVRLGQPLVPELPGFALVARRDHQRAHRLHDVDRARAVAVEVAEHQRVRAAQLACAALGAVDEVVRDVGDVDEALLQRDDARVERERRR